MNNLSIPNNFINATNYASRCNFIFNQQFKELEYENNKLSEITSNSTIYCWSGFLNHLFQYLAQTNLTNITLISGCEDHPSNPNGIIMGQPRLASFGILPCPKNIVKWYAQNAEIFSNFMIPMPIGPNICPLTSNSLKKHLINCDRNKSLFTNVNPGTNPIQRNFVLQTVLQQCPSAVLNPYGDTSEYCRGLQEHIFSLCPPGNGKDTHRAWESIFFGCIPIVEKSPMNDFFASLFPMLVVDRWCDITEDFLMNKYEEIKMKKWRYDLLDVDNFFNHFKIPINDKHKKYQELAETTMIGQTPTYNNILYY